MAAELLSNIKTVRKGLGEIIIDQERIDLLKACHDLIGALERPRDAVTRIMQAVYPVAALTTAIEMGLIDAAVQATEDGASVTIKQLARATSADPNLIVRLMRVLRGIRMFREVGVASFKPTPLAEALAADSKLKAEAIHLASHASAAAAIPEFLSEKGYSNPDDGLDGPFQYAMRTEMHYMDYVRSRDRLNSALNTMLRGEQGEDGENGEEEEKKGDDGAGKERWFDYYPVMDRLQVSSPDDLLIVDVGEKKTEEFKQFRERFPDLQGQNFWQKPHLVIRQVQDGLPSLPLLKGAKAYYTRPFCEDLPDQQLKVALGRIRDVMADNSVLLVADDNLLLEIGVGMTEAWSDMQMMATYSVPWRTEAQYIALFDSVGLEVIGIWRPKSFNPMTDLRYKALFEAVKR